MATSAASSHLISRSHLPHSSLFSPNIPSLIPRRLLPHPSPKPLRTRSVTVVTFALTDASKPAQEQPPLRPLLQELADCFDLPPDYLAQLPSDLRLDLNDAAFDLSNGPVVDECGQELGEMLLNLARAWEKADTATARKIASQFPSLEGSLVDNVKAAFGKRLVSSGRRFTAMGQYGQGELARIANAMTKAGKLLSATPVSYVAEKPKTESRTLKFGDLQVKLTSEKAYTGAAIAFAFGVLSWSLAQGIQNVPESSLEYANDNALTLSKSLRGALLGSGYSSTVLSAVSCVGLLLLGRDLSSKVSVNNISATAAHPCELQMFLPFHVLGSGFHSVPKT